MAGNELNFLNRDSDWLQRYFESKDVQYLGRLYEAYKKKIFLKCFSMVRNEEDAKDLASETFIKAFKSIEQFRTGSPFFPWLNRIANNLCIDYIRKRSRHIFQPLEETQIVTDQNEQSELESRPKMNRDILDVVKSLKPQQRRCFCLFYINNLSYTEIAGFTGYSHDKVRSHIQNGRRRFKILMEQSWKTRTKRMTSSRSSKNN